ncbi:diguanylate cyclase [Pseudomonas sp.]|uniref:GGDEF domain-containing protein n=1 Tax=Pseudomonas sp. TaxID=306 RepID=UPI00273514D8|nr:diguanylate cyclase [Pseudomonas sp.]MDP3816497.1 diguanylate cyclase [Pseudomonas sp.]
MPLPHAWLDDVRPSPYADQLALGFRLLRFARPLEREYREYVRDDSYDLKRIALGVGMLIWLAFAAFDFALIQAPEIWWMLGVRLSVLFLLVLFAWLLVRRKHVHLLQPLSLVTILALGVGASLVVGIAHRVDPSYPYEGLLLVCMASYFLVGLRLFEALACSLLILLSYIAAELLMAGVSVPRLINNSLFLLFGNLMGAVGCYLLEFKSREHFLISRLMRVLADHDSLTGLHNRRSFNRQFERLWRQAQRERCSLALLLCDIDHFKAYNDHYGHQAGDNALQRVGSLLQDAARRPLDMAVRLGGEEFAVLLYDIAADQARQHAEALRQTLQTLDIEHAGSDTATMLTMSIGVACIQPAESGALAQLYEYADRALYEAKAFGRNQVVA